MDIKTLLHNLHDELSCSVCMVTFTEPKQLPCLHSFCLHCLQGIQRTSGRHDVITCPECRRESQVPGGNLHDLPTNFRINSLLDVLAIRDCNTAGVKCGNCDKSSRHSSYCFQCCAFWCDMCINAHNLIKANKGHRVLALKDFQDQDITNVLKRPAFCPRPGHEKKELEFFCKKCKQAICSSCVATTHDGHVKILLEEAANEKKSQVMSAIDSKKKKAQKMRNKISKLDESCDKIQTRLARVKRSAQQFAESIIVVIEAKKQEIFHEADHQAHQSLESLRIRRNEIENKVKTIETAVGKTETLIKRSTNAELAQLDESQDTSLPERVSDERDEIDYEFEDLSELIFEENEALKTKAIAEGIGLIKTILSETKADQSVAEGTGLTEAIVGIEANFVLTTRNAEGKQCYQNRDRVTVEIENQQGHDCATEVRVQDNKSGNYKISYFAKETGACRAVVKVNEEQVRDSPFPVQVKPRQFRPVLSFGQQGSSAGTFKEPFGVAVNARDEIAVTENGNDRVQVFSSNGTYLRSFGRKGNNQGEFTRPRGIACNKNNNIIVVDTANHRVQLFSEQGEYLSQFGGRGNLDHQLYLPHGLSVDNEGNIVVGDTGNKSIKIFSPDGHYLSKIGGDGSFTFPFDCVQYEKYLMVSDDGDDCIKVFDRSGHFLYKFGKKGEGDGEFNEPKCLSVNKAGHLMVCDLNNHRVQVFELTGKFVAKFGSKGENKGEFNVPTSTAVLSDGRIVVSDFYNHRIQIFE
ncbi:E3 ubiquitin-protein ligase TRIM71-like [Stylophora pistillata]|uniref:E3 ubiquitin-protein ligase TRIM71-like n=1 Tax=Stylophora pistillata TaxID=50429 RepID=UPI000C03CF02|nr:E3 ubiquitin-protein ligase TRIM71-like [Stylophora pistillata]